MSVTQPDLRHDLVADTARLAAVAASERDHNEESRRLSRATIDAVVDAGFARHFVPVADGGPGAARYTTLLDALAALGQVCTSTAWFASLTASMGRMAAYLPEAGRAEIWGAGPDTVVVGALMPSGTATRVTGGWRVNGTWGYVSGLEFGAWALVCAAEDDARPARYRFLAVPAHALIEARTWAAVGMRATGSNTLTITDAFVPDHLSFDRDAVMDGRPDGVDDAWLRIPLKAVNGMTFAAPLLGAARGAVSAYRELARRGPAGSRMLPPAAVRAEADIDAADLLLRRVAGRADAGRLDDTDVALATRDCAVAADLLAGAVTALVRVAGTTGLSETNPLERCWRDVTTGAGHVVLRFDAAATAYSKTVLS